ncbi:MAG: hypothetical protein EBX57_11700, partial [Betaproteobacteria bacterium]|nr:hypothetical protein [Betaproteobacteria bacterium]
ILDLQYLGLLGCVGVRALGYAMLKKLKVYAEGTHPHAAQQPKVLEI